MKSQQKQELDGIIDKIIGYFRFHDRKERDDETDMWERINREITGEENTSKRIYKKIFNTCIGSCLFVVGICDR